MTFDIPHTPVMLKEAISYLDPKDGEIFLDCTFGAGSYSKSILDSASCKVIALDRDPNVKTFANNLKNKYGDRFEFLQINFAHCFELLKSKKFNGIVMDLGVSSMQLDESYRGFSFMKDGPLDMRMEDAGISATDFINTADEKTIAEVIHKYGEEKSYKRIARNIVKEREIEPITTTLKLANIIRSSKGPYTGKIDPATKTFQAIRIYINKELESLEYFLEKASELLAASGRLVVVSFHSLEDAIVKTFLRKNSEKKVAKSKYAKDIPKSLGDKKFIILTKKPISPSIEEVKLNIRARSAKLRAGVMVNYAN